MDVPANSMVFTFPAKVASGASFNVTVMTQPASPAQTCTIAHGSGTVTGTDVTNVAVTCGDNTSTISGTVTGLTGSGLVLTDNGGDALPIAANATSFTFTTPIPNGSQYNVAVATPPSGPSETCGIANGSGTAAGSDITNVAATCSVNSYSIGGTVSGLTGVGLVLSETPVGATVQVASAGAFVFPNVLLSGASYAVTVVTNPTSPPQGCTVANGNGIVGGSAISNVTVTCNVATEQLLVSDGGNVVSQLIDPATGSLAPASAPSFILDAGFAGMTADPTGNFLYAAFTTNPAVEAFTVNPNTGAPTPISGSPYALPVSGIGGPIVDPTGTFLYTTQYGPPNGPGIYAFKRTLATGALTPVAGSPFPVPFINTTGLGISTTTASFLYYVDDLMGCNCFQLAGFAINSATGALTSIGAVTSTMSNMTTYAAVHPNGSFLFDAMLDATGAPVVQTYAIDSVTGAITLESSVVPASFNINFNWTGIALSPGGAFGYVTDGGRVWAYSVNAATGAWTAVAGSPFSAVAAGTGGTSGFGNMMAFDASGRYLYVSNTSLQLITGFAADAATGALTPVPGSPTSTTVIPRSIRTTRIP